MKGPKNRLKVKKLFVLGAGASYGASIVKSSSAEWVAPLDKDFCSRIKEIKRERPKWIQEVQQRIIKNWKDHIEFHNFGLERAIILQLGHLEFVEAIHKRRRTEYGIVHYIDDMAHLISFILAKAKESNKQLYKKLIPIIFKSGEKASDIKNRIITFNYDSLLDEHLLKRFKPQEIFFDKISTTPEPRSKREVRFDHPLLIKLHGSVSWRCKTDEFKQIISNTSNSGDVYKIQHVWHSVSGYPAPEDDVSPCIIPPLPNKPITKIKLFQFLWTKASEYLHEAEELVICGYSLPPTDNLALSLFGSFANKNLNKVTVIDPDPMIMKKWRDLLDRKNIGTISWSYYSDLSQFVNGYHESQDT